MMKSKIEIIKTSQHYFSESNTGKKSKLNEFIKESEIVLKLILEDLWENGIEWEDSKKIKHIFLPLAGYYDIPKFISTKNIKIKTDLSARAVKCLSTQICGIIKSKTRKYEKTLFVINQLEQKEFLDDKEKNILRKLKKKILKLKPIKPSLDKVSIELNSICAKIVGRKDGKYDFLELKSIGKKYGKIILPIKYHKHSRKLEKRGNRLNSFLLNNKKMDIRWKIKLPNLKKRGKIVGGDTGKNTILTLSDEQSTNKIHPHGKTLDSIMKKLARKKKGSKGFLKAQKERNNFINWSIKQLNLKNIKQINLEKVNNIFYKQKYSRFMSHWTNSEIEKAIKKLCQDSGVQILFHQSFYCSQRCFHCGLVRKSHRKRNDYKCQNCGYHSNADLNAARNHTLSLPAISSDLRRLKLNSKGFFWSPLGFFNLDGSELTVPISQITP